MGKLEETCASACALLKELSTKEAPATSGSLAEFRQKNPGAGERRARHGRRRAAGTDSVVAAG